MKKHQLWWHQTSKTQKRKIWSPRTPV